MYDELVKRLRELHPEEFGDAWDFAFACQQAMHEAADAIEQLAADLERSKEWEAFWEKEANEALKKFQTTVASKPRWISVEERLPEHMKDVLVWVSIGKAPIVAYDVDCYNERAKRWVCFENDVTHWQPLPQPPKEEE